MKKIRTPIFYGFVIALAGTVLMISLLALDLLGPNAISSDREMIGGTILFLMLYLFLLIGIYFALKKKKQQNNSQLSFKNSLLLGFMISISTALFSVVFTYIFYEILYPKYVNELLLAMKEKMNLLSIPKEKIDEKLAERTTYYSTAIQSGYSFIGNFITGMAFTLLLSFFLKTNKKI
ncbi:MULTISPECIES: DUF4199 domain-containing protein [Aquimarina]|uniref:DUF4199 domain-containing protein n=1 Tax=Aquimarina TaxID=290174 RepID=UPI000D69F027|nr:MULTISPECIES: DUF4199 domain-containing protein [Aquimarina]